MCYSSKKIQHGARDGARTGCVPRRENPLYKCVHDLCAPCGVLRVFIFTLRPQLMQVTYAPDKPWLFELRAKSPKTPNLSPTPESRRRRFWDLLCVLSMIYTLNRTTHQNVWRSLPAQHAIGLLHSSLLVVPPPHLADSPLDFFKRAVLALYKIQFPRLINGRVKSLHYSKLSTP